MSNLFDKVMATLLDGSKNLDTVLAGSGFLDEGTYTFIVQAIDSSQLRDNNKVDITYVTPEGQTFTDKAFYSNKDGTGLSHSVRLLYSGCVPNADDLRSLLVAMQADKGAIEVLTGMKLQATLKRGPGFYTHAVATGGYAAFDGPNAETAKKLTGDFDDIKDARESAKAMGHKQSFVRLHTVKAINAVENAAILAKALAARGTKPAAVRVAQVI